MTYNRETIFSTAMEEFIHRFLPTRDDLYRYFYLLGSERNNEINDLVAVMELVKDEREMRKYERELAILLHNEKIINIITGNE